MGFKRDAQSALAAVAVAMGLDYVSGRALAAFYAQTGEASWLGVVLSGVLFGLLTGAVSQLARRTGSGNLRMLLCRIPGGGVGNFVWIMYCMLLAAAGCMLLGEAAHAGALMLPVMHAGVIAAAFAFFLAGALALSGKGVLRRCGSIFVLLLLGFELAMLFFGKQPEAKLLYEIELKLRGSCLAAVVFAMLHTAVCVCVSAGVVVYFTEGSTRPARLGAFAGAAMLILLLAGNAALQASGAKILALKLPFVALGAGWGSAGFYFNGVMIIIASVLSLAGILQGFLPAAERRNMAKNDVKL